MVPHCWCIVRRQCSLLKHLSKTVCVWRYFGLSWWWKLVSIHTHTHTCAHIHTYAHTHTHMHTHTHTHTHKYTCTHTHACTCIHSISLSPSLSLSLFSHSLPTPLPLKGKSKKVHLPVTADKQFIQLQELSGGCLCHCFSFYAKDSNNAQSPTRDITLIACSGCNGHGTCNFTRTSVVTRNFLVAACDCKPAWTGE